MIQIINFPLGSHDVLYYNCLIYLGQRPVPYSLFGETERGGKKRALEWWKERKFLAAHVKKSKSCYSNFLNVQKQI